MVLPSYLNHILTGPITFVIFTLIHLVFIFRCSSSWSNVFHHTDPHSYVFSLDLDFSIHNKQPWTLISIKIHLTLTKDEASRVHLNLDGAPITSKSHTHPSHSQTSRLLTSSLSLGVPVPQETQCIRGVSQFLGMGVMFSRGGFITPFSQAGPSEKTLWAVPLYQYKAVRHQPGASYDDIRLKLDTLPQWSPPGVQFKLRWGVTYTLTYDKHNVQATVSAGVGEELVHIRSDLHVTPREYPEATDSPPSLWPHNGDPVNFYGTSTRLTVMSDILRCSTVL